MARMNSEQVVKALSERYGWNIIGQFVLNGMVLADRFKWNEELDVSVKDMLGIEAHTGTDPALGDLVEEGIISFEGNKPVDEEMLTLCRASEAF